MVAASRYLAFKPLWSMDSTPIGVLDSGHAASDLARA